MIANLFGPGFEVTHPSGNQLTVISHYALWYGVFVAIVLGVPAARSFMRGFKTHEGQPFWWGSVLAGACFVALSVFHTGSVTFDKGAQTVTFQKRGFLFIPHRYQYPLDQVRYATLETATASRRFVVVFKGGDRMGLSSFTSPSGQSQAADAVNEFLGINPVP